MATADRLIEDYIAAYNQARWDDLGALLADDYAHHSGPSNLDFAGFCRGGEWIRRGLPDFQITVEDHFAADDRVAVRFVGSGTHTGSFEGETPSGRTVTVYGTTIFRIADDRIVEDWEALDEGPFRALFVPA